MIDKWLDAINNSQMIRMVMFDVRKAFDLVDHIVLIEISYTTKSQKRLSAVLQKVL